MKRRRLIGPRICPAGFIPGLQSVMAWALVACLAMAPVSAAALRVRWMAGPDPLAFGRSRVTHTAGQAFTVTRWDVILSGIAFHRPEGGWITRPDWVAVFQGGAGPESSRLAGLPPGTYDRVRFQIGLSPEMNRRDPADWPPEHPLNPTLSGLHWGWTGGWVFSAIEGRWSVDGRDDEAFSFHLATDALRIPVEQALVFDPADGSVLEVILDAAVLVGGAEPLVLDRATATTHSRPGDPVAARMATRLREALRLVTVRPKEAAPNPDPGPADPAARRPGTARDAHPFRLVIPATFPRPALPLDNPLTEEGVSLGRRLFSEPMLSGNTSQSCASCHVHDKAFTDGSAVSVGAFGSAGTRNAMPLFNLAWKGAFFWDGRARTLREQVLQPITNPAEMAATLPVVIARLEQAPARPGYAEDFRRAFGSPEITADRIARALEQYLLVQVSGNSRFDRALRGEERLSEQEARGFELFRTEFDPVRGLRGADCFHCHGGALFQSQRFGNNGLAGKAPDRGRAGVTGQAAHEGLFAVPSLRNVSLTAPYMHDGRFKTLAEVVAHYSHGVSPSPTLDPNLAKHPEGGLRLSADDQAALVAFLETLSDVAVGSSGSGRGGSSHRQPSIRTAP